MNVYLLYYDTDYGDREEWNTFYTPCEAFTSKVKREERRAMLANAVDEEGEPMTYGFHEVEVLVE